MLALTLSSHHDLKPEFPPPSLTYAREPPATPSPPSYPPVLWHPKNNSHANRLNAQKSTGPSSAEGKARSSMNALKTGIDAKTQLIRGETWTALQELIDEYYHRFHPTAPDQRLLVDTLIDCDWLLRRFRAIETQIYERVLDIYDTTLARVFSEHTDEFSRLQRRIDSTQRHYHNALNQLRRLQAEEAAAHPAEPAPEPAPVLVSPQNQTPKPRNGFVPPIPVEPPGNDSPGLAPPQPPPKPGA